MDEYTFRRFTPLKEDLSELNELIKRKGLTREDLKVILTSIELSDMGKKNDRRWERILSYEHIECNNDRAYRRT